MNKNISIYVKDCWKLIIKEIEKTRLKKKYIKTILYMYIKITYAGL